LKARHWLWKVYFYLYSAALLLIWLAAGFLISVWPDKFSDLLYVVLHFFGLLGLYAYVFLRRIGSSHFWKGIFIATVGVYLAFAPTMFEDYFAPDSKHFGYGLENIIFNLPLWIALYYYGFRSPEIWLNPPTKPEQK
jgi:hypothetical protein